MKVVKKPFHFLNPGYEEYSETILQTAAHGAKDFSIL
jgi:hypothetical protein